MPVTALSQYGQLAFKVSELCVLFHGGCFVNELFALLTGVQGCKALNRIQSIVFKAAYRSNENILVCAPTGAGKTNVAMLTILNTIEQVRRCCIMG